MRVNNEKSDIARHNMRGKRNDNHESGSVPVNKMGPLAFSVQLIAFYCIISRASLFRALQSLLYSLISIRNQPLNGMNFNGAFCARGYEGVSRTPSRGFESEDPRVWYYLSDARSCPLRTPNKIKSRILFRDLAIVHTICLTGVARSQIIHGWRANASFGINANTSSSFLPVPRDLPGSGIYRITRWYPGGVLISRTILRAYADAARPYSRITV